MVTDEERDYMYRTFAVDAKARINLGIRRRLAPLMGNDRRKIELMNALLLSLPGTPILYYGDEIGMGDNYYLGDRNGVRTPMQWSADRNAGFSRANPQSLYLPVIIDPEYHYEMRNVEVQHANPHSLLWWTRRILDVRKQYTAFGRGTFESLPSSNSKVFTFLRETEDETILVVANLARVSQHVEIDLSRFSGRTPDRAIRPHELPHDRRAAVRTFAWAARFFLVLHRLRRSRIDRGCQSRTSALSRTKWLVGAFRRRRAQDIVRRAGIVSAPPALVRRQGPFTTTR